MPPPLNSSVGQTSNPEQIFRRNLSCFSKSYKHADVNNSNPTLGGGEARQEIVNGRLQSAQDVSANAKNYKLAYADQALPGFDVISKYFFDIPSSASLSQRLGFIEKMQEEIEAHLSMHADLVLWNGEGIKELQNSSPDKEKINSAIGKSMLSRTVTERLSQRCAALAVHAFSMAGQPGVNKDNYVNIGRNASEAVIALALLQHTHAHMIDLLGQAEKLCPVSPNASPALPSTQAEEKLFRFNLELAGKVNEIMHAENSFRVINKEIVEIRPETGFSFGVVESRGFSKGEMESSLKQCQKSFSEFRPRFLGISFSEIFVINALLKDGATGEIKSSQEYFNDQVKKLAKSYAGALESFVLANLIGERVSRDTVGEFREITNLSLIKVKEVMQFWCDFFLEQGREVK